MSQVQGFLCSPAAIVAVIARIQPSSDPAAVELSGRYAASCPYAWGVSWGLPLQPTIVAMPRSALPWRSAPKTKATRRSG
jgi:hypothetical protein